MKRVFQPTKKRTVLIVDDDAVFAPLWRDELQSRGCKAEIASDQSSALARLTTAEIDLVLVDLCMSEMNGVETVQALRAGRESLPVLVLANPFLGNLERAALQAGAVRSIAKADLSAGALHEAVRSVLDPASSLGPAHPVKDEEARATVAQMLPDFLAQLRGAHQTFTRSADEETRRVQLHRMHRQVHRLADAARLLSLPRNAQMADALEALLVELHSRPQQITPSALRTVAQAIDTVGAAFAAPELPSESLAATAKILVVDDEDISREMIGAALARARLAAISLKDSLAAQQLLEEDVFDLIFLDYEMPGQNGPELCKKIRTMETNRATPVVFVTSHSDFGSRARSTLSGGNDFITKPFLAVELAIKALTFLCRKNLSVSEQARASGHGVPAVAP